MEDFSQAVRTHRFHPFTLRIKAPGIAAGSRVAVRQTHHQFLFGANAFGLTGRHSGESLTRYQDLFAALFNAGTLPFYWGRYEPEEGKPDEANLRQAAQWLRARGIAPKGHPLCWHTVCADWLLAYDNDTIVDKQMARIKRDVSTFAGLIDTWDVINEVVIMPIFDKYDNAVTRICNHLGAVELTLRCFQEARAANPRATLLINDFDLSPAYEELIARLLDRDCPIDAIGLQTHQHQGYHGIEATADVIDRFARFGKPLHFTETTILSGETMPPHYKDLNDYKIEQWPTTPEGEERQCEQVEEYYSYIYSRPEVAALVWWDMVDGNWLRAPSGLVRQDLTPKPAYHRLLELIKGAWWFGEQELVVDADHCIQILAPEGVYAASIGDRSISLTLQKDHRETMVAL